MVTPLLVIRSRSSPTPAGNRSGWGGTGEWAGFLLLSLQGPFRGYIQTVCLRPEVRGKGIGTEIVAWAEARIFRESPNVFMCVSDFNSGASRLYQKLGYEVVGRLENYLVQGRAEILLRKTAGPWSEFHAAG